MEFGIRLSNYKGRQMIKITPHKIAILMGILLSPSVFATDINVEFTATVKATTCNITLTGNNVTNDGNNNSTLRIPKMGLDKITNKTTESQADFKLVASGCSSGISWIDTTLTGNALSSSSKLIIPLSGDLSSTTSNIGMGFKKRTTDDATFLQPNNSADKIRWSTEEMQPDKGDRKSTRLNSSHVSISYAVFCLKNKRRHD